MKRRLGWLAATFALIAAASRVHSQALSKSVDETLSPSCAARSSVLRVCDVTAPTGNATPGSSPRSFAHDEDATSNAAPAQRLESVTVTGRSVPRQRSIEAILQDALAPSTAVRKGPLEAHAGSAGTRYECYAACTGPDCCIEIRTTPSPARDSNLIGR